MALRFNSFYSSDTNMDEPRSPKINNKPASKSHLQKKAGEKLRGAEKVARIPIKVEPSTEVKRKPKWIRAKAPTSAEAQRVKGLLREHKLHTVCEEAACPNLGECFSHGTATFMIMGDICTRRCPFCDVAHGRPNPLDADEPKNLAHTIGLLKLKYVVITSVDRDDLRDGGAGHFVDCIREVRKQSPQTQIEILVPDFRGRMEIALEIMEQAPPDVFNHNLETVPRLYKKARPGADYAWSLKLIRRFKELYGMPPKAYQTDIKLREALALLKMGKYKVQEVSGMVGFDDPANFQHLFRKHFGKSPGSVA